MKEIILKQQKATVRFTFRFLLNTYVICSFIPPWWVNFSENIEGDWAWSTLTAKKMTTLENFY